MGETEDRGAADGRVDEDTVVRPCSPHGATMDAQAVIKGTVAGEEAVEGDTIIRLIEPVMPRRHPSPELPSGADRLPSRPAESPPASPLTGPARADRLAWALRIRGTEQIVPLDVPVVIGRRPGPPRVTELPPPRRIVIPAEYGEVSARHVRIEQLGDSLVVTDLGSTNGIAVHWSAGPDRRLRPGESCVVLPDAIVVLGDGVEVEFLASPEPSSSPDLRSPP